ncbi:hypothetical protein [Absidia glauca]|uniref:C2H2-type domain-containing protein n=1 Tax=Absidia glauca TaxID=4829 RepID=A0A163MT61_ABSGL|nr:hypothetical protein [Absidia glauca]
MSDHQKHSPSGRGVPTTNISDDDHPSISRTKFKRERNVDDDSYTDSNQPNADEYGRHTRSRRHLRSPSPSDGMFILCCNRRHKYQRTSHHSPPPSQHHSRHHRGSYSRSKRERNDGRDHQDSIEGDFYIPNYDRDGYTPGARYGQHTNQVKPQQSNHHTPNHHQYSRHHQRQQQSIPTHMQLLPTSQNIDSKIMNHSVAAGNWPSSVSRIPLADPYKLDYIVSFKQYCDYLRQTQSNDESLDDEFQKRYDDYKEKMTIKQLAQFFANNKEKQWFLEKYHPHISHIRVDDMKHQRSLNFTVFIQALQRGQYDNVQNDMYDSKYTGNSNNPNEVPTIDNPLSSESSSPSSSSSSPPSNDEYDSHLVIKTVPPTIPRQKIIDMCNKVVGFKYLALSEPSAPKKFHRIGWIRFSEETDMQKAFDLLDNQKIDDFTFHLAMNRKGQSTSTRSNRIAPDITSTSSRLSVDLEQAKQLAKVMDDELGKDGIQDVISRAQQVIQQNRTPGSATLENTETSSNHGNVNGKGNELGVVETKKELDLIMAYLRHVHMCCYYCGLECDSAEELNRRCPEPHHRKVSSGPTTESKQGSKNERLTQQWIKNLDHRVGLKVNPPDDERIVSIGGKSLKSEMDIYLNGHIQKEHDAKYKCKVGDCTKAFKGMEFVEKHILSKHGDELQRIKDEVAFYNNYVSDPNHLLPLSNNNSNSNSNQRSNASSGIGAINLSGTMAIGKMGSGSINNGTFGGAPSSFMRNIPAGGIGAPWDKIPRMGFGGNVGWSNSSGAGRLGERLGNDLGHGPSSTSDVVVDLPQDPRQVKSYVDLDAPTSRVDIKTPLRATKNPFFHLFVSSAYLSFKRDVLQIEAQGHDPAHTLLQQCVPVHSKFRTPIWLYTRTFFPSFTFAPSSLRHHFFASTVILSLRHNNKRTNERTNKRTSERTNERCTHLVHSRLPSYCNDKVHYPLTHSQRLPLLMLWITLVCSPPPFSLAHYTRLVTP